MVLGVVPVKKIQRPQKIQIFQTHTKEQRNF